jgi:hypothetical protein
MRGEGLFQLVPDLGTERRVSTFDVFLGPGLGWGQLGEHRPERFGGVPRRLAAVFADAFTCLPVAVDHPERPAVDEGVLLLLELLGSEHRLFVGDGEHAMVILQLAEFGFQAGRLADPGEGEFDHRG